MFSTKFQNHQLANGTTVSKYETHLIFQPTHGNCEVDESGFSLNFRWEMRVGQLRMQEQPSERESPVDDATKARIGHVQRK